MLGEPLQGLTAHDFHPPAYINPHEIFQTQSRSHRFQGKKLSPIRAINSPGSPLLTTAEYARLSCCGEESLAEDGLKTLNNTNFKRDRSSTFNEPRFRESEHFDRERDDFDECEDCVEDHKECDKDQIQCVDECDECLDEHDRVCGQHGKVCVETCDDCDFSCFDCVDWNAFAQNKSLGLSFSVPLLDRAQDVTPSYSTGLPQLDRFCDTNAECQFVDPPVAPLEIPMHHQCLQNTGALWNVMSPFQPCPTNPSISTLDPTYASVPNLDTYAVSPYGCHPATIHNNVGVCVSPINLESQALANHYNRSQPDHSSTANGQLFLPCLESFPLPDISSAPLSRVCEWVMPCGTMCSASFATMTDLKKHVKCVHVVKGVYKCSWQGCAAKFGSEAALNGHVSKKHVVLGTDDDGLFKCTFPGCFKSFMYKQVRDEHLASHNGNKMYCHICDQFLNNEGSNFRRHMASHQPKHEHMLCKHHHLGCKRRFPRLDNLRRHEACCKFGKKAALHHHHHHRHMGR